MLMENGQSINESSRGHIRVCSLYILCSNLAIHRSSKLLAFVQLSNKKTFFLIQDMKVNVSLTTRILPHLICKLPTRASGLLLREK